LPAYSAKNDNRIKRQNRIESIFKDLDYTFFRIEKDSKNNLKELKRLDSFHVDSDISQRDYILIPNEKVDKSSIIPAN
jgi:hypothetical protein